MIKIELPKKTEQVTFKLVKKTYGMYSDFLYIQMIGKDGTIAEIVGFDPTTGKMLQMALSDQARELYESFDYQLDDEGRVPLFSSKEDWYERKDK